MCLAMYLFTENDIDEIEYDAKNPRMYIQKIQSNKRSEDDTKTSKWNINHKNIYYIGSYEGCGCGWAFTKYSYIDKNNEYDREKLANKINARKDLYRLLKSNRWNDSYIIVCWEGDQGEEINQTVKLNIKKIKNIEYEFYELVKYILKTK